MKICFSSALLMDWQYKSKKKKGTIRTINNIDSLVFPSLHFTLLGSFLTLGFQREQNFPKAILVVEDNIKQIKKFIWIRKKLFPVGRQFTPLYSCICTQYSHQLSHFCSLKIQHRELSVSEQRLSRKLTEVSQSFFNRGWVRKYR